MNAPVVPAFEPIVANLEDAEYQRARLSPRPSDRFYLHLSDLREALRTIETGEPLRMLDYGCGSSPYRTLFPKAVYQRADFLQVPGLDYQLGEDSRVPAEDAQFDLVLSTQVLEHVTSPGVYLAECFRLLRPGGRLFLSTHGTFEDHGCPYDFQRWTADGLRLALERAGFISIGVDKLTTGPRALLFLAEAQRHTAVTDRGIFVRFGLALYRRLFQMFRGTIFQMADQAFSRNRVVPSGPDPGQLHQMYICLAAQAVRPNAN